MITNLLEKEGHLLQEVVCTDWENLVDILAAPLIADGSVLPPFAESAKVAVRQFGGYVVLIEDIAFFHGRPEDGVQALSMTLGLLKEPIYLGEKRIKAAFLFAAIDNESHRELLGGLARLMNDEDCLELLREGRDLDAIMKKFKEMEATQ